MENKDENPTEKQSKTSGDNFKDSSSSLFDDEYDDQAASSVKTKGIESKQKKTARKFDDQHGDDNSDVDCLDDAFDLSSSYMQSVMKRKGLKKGNVEEKRCDSPRMKNEKEYQSDSNDTRAGFTVIKKRKARNPEVINVKTPEDYGMEAYQLILNQEKLVAIDFLSQAIDLNCHDFRHYFNRSYCYFSIGKYREALADIDKVISICIDPTELAKIKCRQGQVYCAMEAFEEAEKCFGECLNLVPRSIAVRTEIMRMKIIRLTTMGYSERDIVDAFEGDPNMKLEELITYLDVMADDESVSSDNTSFSSDFEDEIYQSNEGEASITDKFMNALEMHRCADDHVWSRSGFFTNRRNTPSTITEQSAANAPHLVVAHAAAPKKLPPPPSNVNNKAIWVGSLNDSITDSLLKKNFSKFGPIVSVCRLPRNNCAFINFFESSAAQKAIDMGRIEVNGSWLIIKSNVRNK